MPQARQVHAFLGRVRSILSIELPEVLDDLTAVRAARLDYAAPDESLVGIGARRTTVETVLYRRARTHPGIDILTGVSATGLHTSGTPTSGVPHVTGVATTAGVVDADLVIDAGGRHSPLARFLAGIGAPPPLDDAETDGFTYWTQWFQLRGAAPPDSGLPFAHYAHFTAVRFTADAGWFSVCLTGAAEDRLLRGLRDRDRFLAVAAALPPIRDWIDSAVASAVGGVLPMANILSRRRHTVRNGVPCATGLVSVGDAVACNNPMLGRGLALALRHAQHLRDTLRDVPADNVDLPVDYDRRIAPEVDAWYTDTVGWDRSRLTALAEARATATRGPDPERCSCPLPGTTRCYTVPSCAPCTPTSRPSRSSPTQP